MSKENGGADFPVIGTDQWGMTLRDYFAAKAMQGLSSDTGYCGDKWVQKLVMDSYSVADAMLAERAK